MTFPEQFNLESLSGRVFQSSRQSNNPVKVPQELLRCVFKLHRPSLESLGSFQSRICLNFEVTVLILASLKRLHSSDICDNLSCTKAQTKRIKIKATTSDYSRERKNKAGQEFNKTQLWAEELTTL
ncbi:hypothetical protein NL108_007815 [Boleophthalmus pectinirostris]|nr:hypothetical protein NL108_007815 [Boleophthalmus pectinirostris]